MCSALVHSLLFAVSFRLFFPVAVGLGFLLDVEVFDVFFLFFLSLCSSFADSVVVVSDHDDVGTKKNVKGN